MWQQIRTLETRDEKDDPEHDPRATTRLSFSFAALVAVVGACGYVVGETGLELSARYGISQGVVGALGTAIVTSLPELVTTLQLAIGGIIGGNMFDTLFIAASDVAYREGSIYNAIIERSIFWMALVLVMTSVLLLGLLRREKQGPAGIGWESVLLLGLWLGGAGLQIWLG